MPQPDAQSSNELELPSRRSMFHKALAFGGGLAAAGLGIPAQAAPLPPDASALDVRAFGAKGDGRTDDTKAAQAAIDAAYKAGGGRVHFPSGRYRITGSLVFASADRIDVTGDGWTSVLLHEGKEHLFLWKENVPCREVSVRHLCITPSGPEKPPEIAAIACLGGVERSFFSHLFFDGISGKMGSGVLIDRVADTTGFDHCVMWGISGTGIRLARGSEIRIFGGRIIGRDRYRDKSIGLHIATGNGGVHLVGTDVIGLHTAVKIGTPNTEQNREVLLTHATLDSCIHGLVQVDPTYVSIAGCWAASSDKEQILIDSSATGSILVICGGSIFNGGAYGKPGEHNGLVMRAGTFVLSGVTIRHNKGTGILVEGDRVRDYAITGCRIADNGVGASLAGNDYAFTGNVLTHNVRHLIDHGGPNKQIANNVMAEEGEGKPRY